MNESNPCDAALAELLTLTIEVTRNGTTIYRNHLGQKHRIHGPAVICINGDCEWYQNNTPHRTDGAAIEDADGGRYWFLNGERFTEQEYNERIKSL